MVQKIKQAIVDLAFGSAAEAISAGCQYGVDRYCEKRNAKNNGLKKILGDASLRLAGIL